MQENVLVSWLLRLFSLGGLENICQDEIGMPERRGCGYSRC
jgi:hypothetical protein